MAFIYRVRGSYGSPRSARGYYSTPEKAAEAVSKVGGKRLESVFNKDGIAKLIRAMKVDATLNITDSSVTKHSLK